MVFHIFSRYEFYLFPVRPLMTESLLLSLIESGLLSLHGHLIFIFKQKVEHEAVQGKSYRIGNNDGKVVPDNAIDDP